MSQKHAFVTLKVIWEKKGSKNAPFYGTRPSFFMGQGIFRASVMIWDQDFWQFLVYSKSENCMFYVLLQQKNKTKNKQDGCKTSSARFHPEYFRRRHSKGFLPCWKSTSSEMLPIGLATFMAGRRCIYDLPDVFTGLGKLIIFCFHL